jgi:quinol monooxygenase YgiN
MRRQVIVGAAALAGLPLAARAEETTMYGLIGQFIAQPGQRDALTAILLESTGEMPGCLSYVVAHDPENAEMIWITEVWTDKASHQASLQIPAVQAAIGRAMPLIASFGSHNETAPVGGVGLG